jgi:hypothetical protein
VQIEKQGSLDYFLKQLRWELGCLRWRKGIERGYKGKIEKKGAWEYFYFLSYTPIPN